MTVGEFLGAPTPWNPRSSLHGSPGANWRVERKGLANPAQNQAVIVEGRRERRGRHHVRVLLANSGKPALAESASTENISSYGARVRTECPVPPETYLFVPSLQGKFWARERVVYFQNLSERTFALGLEFLARTGDWNRRT